MVVTPRPLTVSLYPYTRTTVAATRITRSPHGQGFKSVSSTSDPLAPSPASIHGRVRVPAQTSGRGGRTWEAEGGDIDTGGFRGGWLEHRPARQWLGATWPLSDGALCCRGLGAMTTL